MSTALIPRVFRVELRFADGNSETYIKVGGTLLEHWRDAAADAGARVHPVASVRITQGCSTAAPGSADVCTIEDRPEREPLAPSDRPETHFAVIIRAPGLPPDTYRRFGGSSFAHAAEALDRAGLGARISVRPVVERSQ